MAPAPGDLLRLSDLEINNKVQAMFEDGFWYNAYVLDKTGSGANTTVLVHFNGYPKSHRRWVHSAHNRVRARLPPSQLRREHEEAMFAGADTGRLGPGQPEVDRGAPPEGAQVPRGGASTWCGSRATGPRPTRGATLYKLPVTCRYPGDRALSAPTVPPA